MQKLDSMQQTPLIAAVYGGVASIVEDILKFYKEHKLDINTPDRLGNTPLHHACRCASDQVLFLLLHFEEVDVRAQNVDQNTPLHYFCEKFSSPNCKEPLTKFLELGADVNAVNR